ncbi:hypothetical protein, partial [Priestia megaterium]|uniref:hypothetical protein n=1 Tax=Priestia megaterium TaxID=1404 RepID=UPI002FFED330
MTKYGPVVCVLLICSIFVLVIVSKKKNIQKIVLTYLFITILFPKSGVKLGGLPLTVSNIFLCLSLFFCVIFYFAQRNKKREIIYTDNFVKKYIAGSLGFF